MTNCFARTTLWGDLFRDEAVAHAFSAESFAATMVRVELSWTVALAKTGIVPEAVADRCAARLQEFACDFAALGSGSARDGLPVVELVRQMRLACEENAAEAIHRGATSQDIVDTAMVLTCLDLLELFRGRLLGVLKALDDLHAVHGQHRLMARTRMQAALPIPVAARIDAWRAPLAVHLEATDALSRTLSYVQFGGPVGLRTDPDDRGDAVARHAALELGLSFGPVWHTDRSRFVTLGHWLTLVSGSLAKIAQDLCLMSQQGIDEVRFAGLGTSSAMPHKQNPVRAELVVALARLVAGQQAVLSQAMIHEQERSGAAWALEWLTLPAMFEATGAALNTTGGLLTQITFLGEDPAS